MKKLEKILAGYLKEEEQPLYIDYDERKLAFMLGICHCLISIFPLNGLL